MNITYKQSPNYTPGRQGKTVKKIVIHWIGTGTYADAVNHFLKDSSDVSAHYVVSGNNVTQCVKEEDTAWHAGNWQVNLETIGIEHDAIPGRDLSDDSYTTSGMLIKEIADRHAIPLDREHIIGHREIVPTQCPGTVNIDKLIALAKNTTINQKIEELEKEIEEIRLSRNKWKNLAQDTQEKYVKEVQSLSDHITSLQLSSSEMNAQIVSQGKMISNLTSELERLKNDSTALQKNLEKQLQEKDKQITEQAKHIESKEKEIKKIMEEVNKLMSKKIQLPKKFYKSKVIWINFIALIALIAQEEYGFIISLEWQGAILAIVNFILRGLTKEELDWSLPNPITVIKDRFFK